MATPRAASRAGFDFRDHFVLRRPQRRPFRSSPTGPRVAPPRQPAVAAAGAAAPLIGRRRPLWSVAIFILLLSGIGIRAYRDLSRPRSLGLLERPLSLAEHDRVAGRQDRCRRRRPSPADPRDPGQDRRRLCKLVPRQTGHGRARGRRYRRDGLTGRRCGAGDDHGRTRSVARIVTAVAAVDGSGGLGPSYCASACVFVFAGGTNRYGVEGSELGVHQFVSPDPGRDPVAKTQRTTGMVLSYMTRMGVSSAVVEAMTATGTCAGSTRRKPSP